MPTPKKLNDEQERTVAIAYLCGGSTVLPYVTERYGISKQTVTMNIVGKRSKLG